MRSHKVFMKTHEHADERFYMNNVCFRLFVLFALKQSHVRCCNEVLTKHCSRGNENTREYSTLLYYVTHQRRQKKYWLPWLVTII